MENGDRYPVTFADEGCTVRIEGAGPAGTPSPLEGRRTSERGGVSMYEVAPMPAARFVVRTGLGGQEAELTILGSGRPVISSVRGRLERR